jgi:hypothetical protein
VADGGVTLFSWCERVFVIDRQICIDMHCECIWMLMRVIKVRGYYLVRP